MSDETEKTTDETQVAAESPAAEQELAPQNKQVEEDSLGQTEEQAVDLEETADMPDDDLLREDEAEAEEAESEESDEADEPIEDTTEEEEFAEEESAEEEDESGVYGVAAQEQSATLEPEEIVKDWYILKVQSNRERSIADALKRKIAIEGLDDYFGDVVVPTEKVTEFKGGKKKVVERKLYPGYIVVHMCITDDTWFAVRETSGIGDFTGSGGKPTPMLASEVSRIIQKDEEEVDDSPKLNINFKISERVKIKEGTFESFEGEVTAIDEQNGRITVMINIFGRSTPVELEYWQVEVL